MNDETPAPPLLRSPHLHAASIDDDLVIYDPIQARAHRLNRTAATIWRRCDGHVTVGDLTRGLANELGTDAPGLERDVTATIDRFLDEGLVQEVLGRPAGTSTDPPTSIGTGAPDRAERREDVDPRHRTRTLAIGDRRLALFHPDEAVRRAVEWYAASLLVDDEADQFEPADPNDATGSLSSLPFRLNRLAEASDTSIVLHAAAVARGEHSVLLVGDPGAGKSTLVAGLVQRGLAYLTDEAIGVRIDDGTLTPYRKRIALKSGSWPLFADDEPVPEDVGARFDRSAVRWLDHRRLAPAPLPVAAPSTRPVLVAFPIYTAGAEPHQRSLPTADALLALLGNNFNLPRAGRPGFEVLHRLATSVPCVELRYGSLADAVALVEQSFGAATRHVDATRAGARA